MNWILATVGVIFLICIAVGIYKGAIKIAVSLAATLLTFVLVFFLTPYVSKGIASLTPLDDMIESQVVQTIANAATSLVTGGDNEDGVVSGTGLTEESVRKVLEAAGLSEEQLNAVGIAIADIVNGNISSEDLAQYGISSSILDGLSIDESVVEKGLESAEVPRDIQIAAIEGADLPEVFKSLLLTNNNNEIYKKLGVDTFVQYVAKFLSKLIINVVAFLLTLILVTIVLRAIIFALDIVSNLPVLGLVNRLAGGVAGAVGALIIVWVLFIIVTLLYTTSVGRDMYNMIQSDSILKVIYDYNPVMRLATILK